MSEIVINLSPFGQLSFQAFPSEQLALPVQLWNAIKQLYAFMDNKQDYSESPISNARTGRTQSKVDSNRSPSNFQLRKYIPCDLHGQRWNCKMAFQSIASLHYESQADHPPMRLRRWAPLSELWAQRDSLSNQIMMRLKMVFIDPGERSRNVLVRSLHSRGSLVFCSLQIQISQILVNFEFRVLIILVRFLFHAQVLNKSELASWAKTLGEPVKAIERVLR